MMMMMTMTSGLTVLVLPAAHLYYRPRFLAYSVGGILSNDDHVN